MTQLVQSSFVCTKPGSYAVKAERIDGKTDLLSVYVDRVKKLWTDIEDQPSVEGKLYLRTGDVVESTGTLTVERIFEPRDA